MCSRKGVQRLLDNVIKSLTTMSMMSFSTTALGGVVGALVMLVGAHAVLGGKITVGQFMSYTAFLAFMIAPVFQVVGIGTQLTEAIAGLERTREVLDERPEDEDPRRTVTLPDIVGELAFDNVSFAYEPGKPVLQDVSFLLAAGDGDGAGGFVGLGEIHDHRAGRGVSRAAVGARAGGRRGSRHGAARFLPHAARRRAAGVVPV